MADDFSRLWFDDVDDLDAEAMNDLESRQEARVSGNLGSGIELGYAASTSTFTTTSTATNGVAVTGLSVTITVGVRPINVCVRGNAIASSATSGGGLLMYEDGAPQGLITVLIGPHSGTGDAPGDMFVALNSVRRMAPAAGNHTYAIYAKNFSAGTLTISAGAGTTTTNGPMAIQVLEV